MAAYKNPADNHNQQKPKAMKTMTTNLKKIQTTTYQDEERDAARDRRERQKLLLKLEQQTEEIEKLKKYIAYLLNNGY